MVHLIRHDLEFILRQIKLSEAHTAAINAGQDPAVALAALVDSYGGMPGGTGGPVQGALMPYGLRTVDGSYNNFTPDRIHYGSADQMMDRLLDPVFNVAESAPANLHYPGQPAGTTPTSYQQPIGTVYDSQPRLISNLVADQTLANPAAIAAALTVNGLSGQALYDAVSAIHTAYKTGAPDLADLLLEHGVTMDGDNVLIPNVSADLGDTAPYNGFFTIFGQFFDHGLDLTAKGGSGSVVIPLQPDDPLYVPGSSTNFMILTRATNQPGADGVLGTADDIRENGNETTPWIDLNQVYTSNASHQSFLREYTMVDGKPVATGHMLEGLAGGPPTWGDVKAQAKAMLGIEMTDAHVGSVPLLLTDLYGEFVRGPNGFAQVMIAVTITSNGTTTRTLVPVEGRADGLSPSDVTLADLPAGLVPAGASVSFAFASAGRAFLNDIAHTAAPVMLNGVLQADADDLIGNPQSVNTRGQNTTYDDELLDEHFIVGDGRGNENIALTSIHTVFHGEHNRQVDEIKKTVLATGDLAFINEWLAVDVTAVPAPGAALVWDGERLFQAARFSTEMVYQHLVFEEFARSIAPQVDAFLFSNTVDIDPAISQEFAQVVYRFGHSMLNETVDIFGMGGNATAHDQVGLIEAFLNPELFESYGTDAASAAGAILRGMGRQHGNEIDEFMTSALRDNLVGLPLDLAALNLARARDTGVPSLNEARRQFFEDTNDTYLKPYVSWTDFAQNIKHPLSIINFIAAYGQHETVLSATTAAAKRDAAISLVLGGETAPADRLDFLNSTGSWANRESGLNKVDFWIGGLAEAKMTFGGMLGSTFTFVFENQMERLQDGDRFYYLSRTQGLNLLNELEADSFAQLLRRNTDTEASGLHVNGAAFQTADYILELDQSKQYNAGLGSADPTGGDPILGAMGGQGGLVQRGPNFLKFNGDQHVVLGGTSGNDTLVGGGGDDTIWGEGGDDDIEGGFGVDHLHGGDGDDLITDRGTDIGAFDVIHGDAGNDVINPGMGIDLVFGGAGQDFIFGGTDDKDINGGLGNDFIRGGSGFGFLKGNEGDDWIEGGDSFDTLAGENSELFFNSTIIGHDVLDGRGNDNDYDAESGDDIMVQGAGIQRNNGMAGFDWAIHKGDTAGADSDLGIPIFTNQQNNILRDRFDLVEGLSGWKFDDRLTGRENVIGGYDANGNAAAIDPTLPLDSYSNALLEKNVGLIAGLDQLVSHLARTTVTVAGKTETIVMDTADASDILLGGGGSDLFEGKAGNDIIDGDKWLNVRIAFTHQNVAYTADGLGEKVFRVADYVNGAPVPGAVPAFGGQTLDQLMFARTVNPGALSIVREIVEGDLDNTGRDIAVFRDLREHYTITVVDGKLQVAHTGFGAATSIAAFDEGTDTLTNIEVLRFADQDVSLTPPRIELDGFDTTPQAYRDTFGSASYSANAGLSSFSSPWTEASDDGSATGGAIRITGGQLRFGELNGDGAAITRNLNLADAAAATLSFTVSDDNITIGDTETLTVSFARDGVNFDVLQVYNGLNGGTVQLALTGPFGPNAAIRFATSAMSATGEFFYVDNVNVAVTKLANPVREDISSTFTENGAAFSIGSEPRITDEGGLLQSARIVLTNAFAGDVLAATGLPNGITAQIASANGQIVVTLSGEASVAAYQAAIQAVTYRNTSNAPATTPRLVEVTVNDGLLDSNVATHTITVISVNDAPVVGADSVITNIASGPIAIPDWALLANDNDPDGPLPLSIVSAQAGGAGVTASHANGMVTVNNTTGNGRTLSYTVSDGALPTTTGAITVTRDTTGTVDGTAAANILIGDAAGSTFDAGEGDDVVYAGGGDDTIVWNANASSLFNLNPATDGRDFVDGQGGIDTIRVNTRAPLTLFGATLQANNEAYVIYERSAAIAAGFALLNALTEIVITRNGQVILELDNIEEIQIGQLNATGGTAPTGGNAGQGDTVTVVGDFTGTSLALNTITIDGTDGNDVVDITALQSAHRIVFKANGGQDIIVGTLRPQDVVIGPDGSDLSTYARNEEADGSVTYSKGDHTVRLVGSLPPVEPVPGDEDDEDDDGAIGGGDDDDDDDGAGPVDPTPQPDGSGLMLIGTGAGDVLAGQAGNDTVLAGDGTDILNGGAGRDVLRGEAGNDVLLGGDGDDVLTSGAGDDEAHGGSGNDLIFGNDGDDLIFGDEGDDVIEAGAGSDRAYGGAGNDRFVATINDGNDMFDGGEGSDTLDYAAVSANLKIDLGNGFLGAGSVSVGGVVQDTFYGFENVIAGSGHDVIIASQAVNILDGGLGEDVFRFGSAGHAHGDTIYGFTAGDKIDFSAIAAGVAGGLSLEAGSTLNAIGDVVVTFELRGEEEFTIIRGNTAGDAGAEFELALHGRHALTQADFTGVS